MTITEYTLKIEHARYKKALEDLSTALPMSFDNRHAIVYAALNPPPPAPVTLADILAALGPNNGGYLNPSIEIFCDGSATVHLKIGNTRNFTTVQQALDFCKEEA